jgi:uncharacterized protein (DUF1499 family)
MRNLKMTLLGLLSLGILLMAGLSISSRYKSPAVGLSNGRLLPCPETPNCVSSEAGEGVKSAIEPLLITSASESAWADARQAVSNIGGNIVEETPGYLRATVPSTFFRFIDDLELRLDADAGVIHIRSASRVGHSDMGANRKRIDRLRSTYAKQ